MGAVLRDAFYSPRPASRGLPSSPETAAPTAQHSPPGKSTVAVINIGMWLGMRTAQGQVLLLQMSSVTVKKSQAAYMPSCPLPACFFFFSWLKILLKFQEVRSQKPKRQDFPNLMSNLSFIDNAL